MGRDKTKTFHRFLSKFCRPYGSSFFLCIQYTIQSIHHDILQFFSAGVGRTGVFISLSIVLERMQYEGVVDVFQTVRTLRTQRPAMVQTEVMHLWCSWALILCLVGQWLFSISKLLLPSNILFSVSGSISVLLSCCFRVPFVVWPLHGQLTISRPGTRSLKKLCHPPHLW